MGEGSDGSEVGNHDILLKSNGSRHNLAVDGAKAVGSQGSWVQPCHLVKLSIESSLLAVRSPVHRSPFLFVLSVIEIVPLSLYLLEDLLLTAWDIYMSVLLIPIKWKGKVKRDEKVIRVSKLFSHVP